MQERGIKQIAVVVTLLLVSATGLLAQAIGWSREELAQRERAKVTEEGIAYTAPKQNFGDVTQGNIMQLGSSSIRNAKQAVRDNSGGESAMLRYYQHRDLVPPKDSTLHLGPWYADIIWSESVGAQYIKMSGGGVDFNRQNGRGRYLKDGFDMPILSTLSLNNYILLTRHMDFSYNISLSYAYYPFKTQEDTWYMNLSDEGAFATFSTEVRLARDMRLMLYDDILYRTDFIDTRGKQDVYGGQEYQHFENTVGADFDWMASPRDNISASVSRRDVISFSDEFDSQEGAFYNEMLAYTRQVTPFMSAGVVGEISQSYYKKDSRPNINMYRFRAFTVMQLTRRVVANANLGYGFSTTDSERGSSSGNLEASFGLGHQISENRYQELTYRRIQREAFDGGVDVTDGLSYRYDWKSTLFPGSFVSDYTKYTPVGEVRNGYADWRNRLDLHYSLNRRWTLDFYTSYDMRMNDKFDDIDEQNPETPDVNSDYTTWVIHLGTGRNLTRKTRFEVYAEHAMRSSDNEDLEYTQDAIGANLNWFHKF